MLPTRTIVVAALLVVVAACRTRSPCERAFRAGNYSRAVTLCKAEFGRSGNVRARVMLAQAYQQKDDRAAAERVARELLGSFKAGVGHRVLGHFAYHDGDIAGAADHALHALAWDWRPEQWAADAFDLSRALWHGGYVQAALSAADLARRAAQRAGKADAELSAELSRAQALRRLGANRLAEAALLRALALSPDDCARIWPNFELGMLWSDVDQPARARAGFETAQTAPPDCPEEGVSADTLAMNFSWVEYVEGHPDRALDLIAEIPDGVATLLIRARIARDRGAYADADQHLDRARNLPQPDADWRWEIEFVAAQVAEARGDAATAERTYRDSIAAIAALRRLSPGGDASAVIRLRHPYDGLIALLGRQARWREVLAVILELDASELLAPAAGPRAVTAGADRPTLDAVIEAWRGRELVIVHAGDEQVVRLHLHDGQFDGAATGDAAAARTWTRALFGRLDDHAAARGLAHLIVPPGATDRPLHVLLVGRLGRVPLAALRDDDDTLVIARRPLLRVLSLDPRPARVRVRTSAVVLADPTGDLRNAAVAGAEVAARLGVAPSLQAAATSDRLWSARAADVLHVAAHVDDDGTGPVLRLADRAITAGEIVAHQVAPRVAVFASCGAAIAEDDQSWGSLAQALLAAGTDLVIAPDRSIGDGAALAFVRALYAAPAWPADPARALAQAQVALATTPGDWSAFTALAGPP